MKTYLTRKEAADYLEDKGIPYSHNTLQKLATVGGGPEYQVFGNRALYTPENLDRWIEQKISAPRATSA